MLDSHLTRLEAALRGFERHIRPPGGLGGDCGQEAPGRQPPAGRGNGGSAAQAQHLTAELVGRYEDDRAPLSAHRAARGDVPR